MNITNKPLLSLCAGDIMSRNITLIPRKMSLQAAARTLARAEVTGAPIVDDHGHCVGVLSATDFMHAVENEPNPQTSNDFPDAISQPWEIPECDQASCACVEDYMTKDPVLVIPATRVGELAQIMMDARIHRVIVVDPTTNSPCGIVSSMDLLGVLARANMAMSAVEDEATLETFASVLS